MKKKTPPEAISGEVEGASIPPGKALEVAETLIDKAQRLQAPAVARYVQKLRDDHPGETPAQIIERLEKRYLTMVTGSGSAVGATAAVPGVGTVAALGAVTGETLLFLEASALLGLAIAEVHGIPVHQKERRKALVLAVALGEEGVSALGKLVGTGGSPLRRLGGAVIPGGKLTSFNQSLINKLIRKYALKRAPLLVGKLLPAGIGAAVGGIGNRALGKRVIANARQAYGPAPTTFVIDGSVVDHIQLPDGER